MSDPLVSREAAQRIHNRTPMDVVARLAATVEHLYARLDESEALHAEELAKAKAETELHRDRWMGAAMELDARLYAENELLREELDEARSGLIVVECSDPEHKISTAQAAVIRRLLDHWKPHTEISEWRRWRCASEPMSPEERAVIEAVTDEQ